MHTHTSEFFRQLDKYPRKHTAHGVATPHEVAVHERFTM